MDKVKSNRNKALIFAVIAIVLLVAGFFVVTRPVSYGLKYYHAVFYDGEDFNGTITFYSDNTVLIQNTSFVEGVTFFYYYKNGYVFITVAETQEEYEAEVAAINEDFEGAVNSPFYASKINAFKCTSEGPDGYRSVYLCQSMVLMALFWGAIELALIGLALASAARCKKEKSKALK